MEAPTAAAEELEKEGDAVSEPDPLLKLVSVSSGRLDEEGDELLAADLVRKVARIRYLVTLCRCKALSEKSPGSSSSLSLSESRKLMTLSSFSSSLLSSSSV